MENKRPFKTIYTCFPQGKHKVLTMSYDDGKIFDRKLIEIFNKYGIKGTFHLNTGIMPVDEDRIQLSEVKEQGAYGEYNAPRRSFGSTFGNI